MNAGQHDDFGIDPRRLACQREAVANDVGDAMEDLRRLVIMRQDHRIPALLQRLNSVDIGGEDRPLDGGNLMPDLGIKILPRRKRGRCHGIYSA